MNTKLLKMLSTTATVVGLVANLVVALAGSKITENQIDESVKRNLDERERKEEES